MKQLAGNIGLREALVITAILVGLLACAFPGVFLRGEMAAPGDFAAGLSPWDNCDDDVIEQPYTSPLHDIYCQFYPYYILTREALADGEWPLWNAFGYGGMPLLANAQSAVFYPPRLVHAVTSDVPLGTTIHILLKLLLCGLTAYVCVRGLGLRRLSALFMAVAWMFSSYNFVYPFWLMADVCAWVPLLFLAVERALQGRYRTAFCLTAFSATLMLLAGHPETVFIMSLGVGLYFVFRVVIERRNDARLWKPGVVLLAAWIVALLASAAQLLPFLEYLQNSLTFQMRTSNAHYDASVGLSIVTAAWIPRFFGTGAENNVWGEWDKMTIALIYPGVAVWLGAALALRRKSQDSLWNRRTLSLALVTLCCVLAAYDLPPFQFVRYLPIFGSANMHFYLAFLMFALPLIATLALDRWLGERPKLASLAGPLLVALLLAGATAAVYSLHKEAISEAGMTEYVTHQMIVAALLALSVLLLSAGHCIIPNRRIFALLFAAVLAFDLLFAVRGPSRTAPREAVIPDTPVTDFLQAGDPAAITSTVDSFIPEGLLNNYGLHQYRGRDGMLPERWPKFMQFVNGEDVVKYFVVDKRLNDPIPAGKQTVWKPVADLDCLTVYENTQRLPQVLLFPKVEVIPSADMMFDEFDGQVFAPEDIAFLESPLEEPLPETTATEIGHGEVVERHSTHVRVKASATQDCILTLLEGYYPGWTAAIDGEPAALFPVDYAFRGVRFPEGEHDVDFVYRPASFRIGLVLSTITLLFSVLAGFYALARRGKAA